MKPVKKTPRPIYLKLRFRTISRLSWLIETYSDRGIKVSERDVNHQSIRGASKNRNRANLI